MTPALLLFLLVAPMLALSGCAGTSSVKEPQDAGPEESARLYQQVVVNSPGRADDGNFVCYLGESVIRYDDGDVSLVYVYDKNFRSIGFYLSNGATYRLGKISGDEVEEEFLGNHAPQASIGRLVGIPGPYLMTKL